MDLVDINDGILQLRHAFHDAFDPVLELATILCSGYHRAHIHLVYLGIFESFGHVAFFYPFRQAVDECGLADSGFAHMQRVVLVAPAKDLDGTIEFGFATDKRVMVRQEVIDACYQLRPFLFAFKAKERIVFIAIVLCIVQFRVVVRQGAPFVRVDD